ncbi:MAG TPA: hypothetical protein VNF75_08495 [Candidatus Dormibacteraeota bacterium]|nr:hypothetical protein [Candidatus Dormibacteraeota bacterium]
MSASRSSQQPSRTASGVLFALAAILIAVLSLLAMAPSPQPNGLGLLPETVAVMQGSGLTLNEPAGTAAIRRGQAVAVAQRQGRQDRVEQVVLAEVTAAGSSLGAQPRLCWVVLLQANPDASGNLPAPGQIDLYLVLVDAHTGRFLDGVIAFQGGPHTGVGSE